MLVEGFIGQKKMKLIEEERIGEKGERKIGIRKENIYVRRERGKWKGKVINEENMGEDKIIYVEKEKEGIVNERMLGEKKYNEDDVILIKKEEGKKNSLDEEGKEIR